MKRDRASSWVNVILLHVAFFCCVYLLGVPLVSYWEHQPPKIAFTHKSPTYTYWCHDCLKHIDSLEGFGYPTINGPVTGYKTLLPSGEEYFK